MAAGPPGHRQIQLRIALHPNNQVSPTAHKKIEGGASPPRGKRRPHGIDPTPGCQIPGVALLILQNLALPEVLESELDQARTARAHQLPEIARLQVSPWAAQVRIVGNVEELGAELEPAVFLRDNEVPQDREVNIPSARSIERIATYIS